jgi:hypothetical protein
VANNYTQLAQIVKKLKDGTLVGSVIWEQGILPHHYQTRFGDFLITISGNMFSSISTLESMPSLEVKRLDGRTIAKVGRNISATDQIPPDLETELRQLYSMLSDRSQDLEELLKIIP